MNFESCSNLPKNNLNLIRLLASVSVTLSHSYILTGHVDREPMLRLTGGAQTFGFLAVFIFFVISGFLISRSFDRHPHIADYVVARALRIYPALLAILLICALPLGMAVSSLGPENYLKHPDTWRYILDNLLFRSTHTAGTLPGVFGTLTVSQGVNGALWSLRLEVYAYLLVILFGATGVLAQRGVFNLAVAGMVLLYLKPPMGFFLIPADWDAPNYMPMLGFLVGAFVYVNRSLVACRLRYIVLAAALYLMYRSSPWTFGLLACTAGYITLALGFHPRLQLGWVKKNDYSYGIYVFSFPVQQTLLLLSPSISPSRHFAYSMLIVLPMAIASWHLLERPALQLKKRWLKRRAPPGAPVDAATAV